MTKSTPSPQEGLQRTQGYKQPTGAGSIAKPGHGWQATQATGGAVSAEQFDFYAGPPEPGDRFFRAFSLDHDEGLAAVAFERLYGRPPEFVFESRGNLLCGPIPGEVL